MAAFRCIFSPVVRGQYMFSLSRQLKVLSIHAKRTVTNSLSIAPLNLSRTSAPTPVRNINDASFSTVSRSSSTIKSDVEDYSMPFDSSLVDSLLQNMEGDLPISDMPNPFVRDYPRCFLCKQNVKLDHKNVRLLSQFVSPYTGRIYGRSVTGLCIPMQKRISNLIKRARRSGYMPVILKDPKYLQDPQPFDPMSRRRAS